MRGLKDTVARLAAQRGLWNKLLATAERASPITPESQGLVETHGFGSNPGDLRLWSYAPPGLRAGAPLVVVLHGCTQTAAGYDHGTGWTALAARHGFAVLFPEQQRTNNSHLCFSWFEPSDIVRDAGEPLSIRQMVEHMVVTHRLDRTNVYVTGLSAGGAMTAVMLATYPDVFAGGAIVAGLPYGCATSVQSAFECMFQGASRPASAWGNAVRNAAPHHRGPWPKVSIWHGGADTTVVPTNASESLKQWIDVHGLTTAPTIVEVVAGYPHSIWRNAAGDAAIESYTITGMAHGVPIDADGAAPALGKAAPFILDAGISSTLRIAAFWSLIPQESAAAFVRPKPTAATAAQAGVRAARAAPPAYDPESVISAALRTAGLWRP